GWIKEGTFILQPAGTAFMAGVLSSMTVTAMPESTVIRFPLGAVIPYRAEQSLTPAELTLTLYGCAAQGVTMRSDPSDTLLSQIDAKSISPDVCRLRVSTTLRQWWGYDVRYEGSDLVLEIRKPWTAPDIQGMVIALDPGHGDMDHGATGPLGTTEKAANLLIARQVKRLLEAAGAKPFLTRNEDVFVPLPERGRIAWEHKARLFISIHCNAAGQGSNPVTNNGYSTYFNQPQSADLARAVHKHYSLTKLPDFGLYYADLAVCRITQMPAILTEQAFQIVPAQEQLIFDPRFQKKCAHAILRGILEFVREKPRTGEFS
ncbi:MAG TPA: N-acetylmuramoyl-L-alanine amidase, partial [Elusimicrobiota bacterium]|nr:N-acetylmuramoyl-L-alanine amidase [Elusimicrobiota bacterium]